MFASTLMELWRSRTCAPSVGSPACLEALEPRKLLSAYHLTFDDEFNTLDLADGPDADGWMVRDYWYNPYHVDGHGNPTELQYYADPAHENYNPFSVSNGVLTITAKPTPTGFDADGQPYVSGEITTTKGSSSSQDPNSLGFSQKYGYFETRVKLPAGKGLWPAFWLIPENGGWPPEYDIFEVLGHDPDTIWQTSHWGTKQNHLFEGAQYPGVVDTSDGFHTFGFEWDAQQIKWYVDGTLTQVLPNRVNQKMYMLLNLGIGGWAGTPDGSTSWPAEMKIDYVRVYSKDPSIPAVTPDSGYSVSPFMPTGDEPDHVDLPATGDVYVHESNPTTKYGASTSLMLKKSSGANREVYLKFNISSVSDVDHALVRLRTAPTNNFDTAPVRIFGVSDTSWSEGNVNWNNRPAAGATALSTVEVTTGKDPVTGDDATWWYTWDVTDYVQQQKASGKTAVAFVLRADQTIAPVINFRSEEVGGTGDDPVLRIIEAPAQGSQTTLPAVEDAYVRDGTYADQEHGNEDRLVVKKDGTNYMRQTFLTFNLAGVSSIPSGKLRLYLNAAPQSGTADITVHAVSNTSWDESTINWNNKPAVGTTLDSLSIDAATAGWYEWDVTAYLQQEKSAGRNVVSLAIKSQDTTQPGFLFSSEEDSGTTHDPQLVIGGSGGGGSGTIYSENFNDGTADGLTNRGGTWSVNTADRLVGENLGGANNYAIRTIDASSTLPTDFDFDLVARSKNTSGWEHALVIFDYVNNSNFKYAGFFVGTSEWRIGQVVNGTKTVLGTLSQSLAVDTDYALKLRVRGDAVSLLSGGVTKVSYTFGGTINDGLLGFGVENGQAVFDDLLVTAV